MERRRSDVTSGSGPIAVVASTATIDELGMGDRRVGLLSRYTLISLDDRKSRLEARLSAGGTQRGD